MDIFLQQLINGLVLGSVYALVALGYTMVYGILELINFAHGEITMMGAMVALAVIGALGLAAPGIPGVMLLGAGLLVAIPACMALGLLIERVAYRPLRNAPRLAPLITAIGVSIILQNIAMLIWGKQYIAFPAILPQGRHMVLGATISDTQIIILLLAASIMLGLSLPHLVGKGGDDLIELPVGHGIAFARRAEDIQVLRPVSQRRSHAAAKDRLRKLAVGIPRNATSRHDATGITLHNGLLRFSRWRRIRVQVGVWCAGIVHRLLPNCQFGREF